MAPARITSSWEELALNADPVLFARELTPPLIIDEIQYAPELLSAIKQLADAGAAPGAFWLTGSQNFQVMRGSRETLAGRVAILNLCGLSDEEKQLTRDQKTPCTRCWCFSTHHQKLAERS